jgi:hypothetical protein
MPDISLFHDTDRGNSLRSPDKEGSYSSNPSVSSWQRTPWPFLDLWRARALPDQQPVVHLSLLVFEVLLGNTIKLL